MALAKGPGLLDLPLELRLRIYEILFFGGEEDERIRLARGAQDSTNWINRTVAYSYDSIYKVHPYGRPRHRSKKNFSVSIFRTNRAIQSEAEPVFYGLAFFIFRTVRPNHGALCWQFISGLCSRYRKMIRRVELLYFPGYPDTVSLAVVSRLDWMLLMRISSQECTALQSLTLWVHGTNFTQLAISKEKDPWIKAFLPLKALEQFTTPVTTPWKARVFPLLQSKLSGSSYGTSPKTSQEAPSLDQPDPPFSLLRLPVKIRAMVFGHALLPEPSDSSVT